MRLFIRKRSCGFTLVEMMVSTTIVALASGIMMAVLRMGQQSWQVGQARMTVSMELRRGLDAMSRELASSQSGKVTFPPVDGAPYTSITFSVPQEINNSVLDGSGNLQWSAPISYSLGANNGNQLQRIQSNTTAVLANGVTVLQFRRQTANIVEISMTVLRGTNTGDFTNQGTLSTQVRLRN